MSRKGGQSEKIVVEMIERQGIEEGDEDEEDQQEEVVYDKDELEDKCCEQFLRMFLIGSESSFLDSIDLILMLKCMPQKIVKYSLKDVKLYQLATLQQSVIAFLNEE